MTLLPPPHAGLQAGLGPTTGKVSACLLAWKQQKIPSFCFSPNKPAAGSESSVTPWKFLEQGRSKHFWFIAPSLWNVLSLSLSLSSEQPLCVPPNFGECVFPKPTHMSLPLRVLPCLHLTEFFAT